MHAIAYLPFTFRSRNSRAEAVRVVRPAGGDGPGGPWVGRRPPGGPVSPGRGLEIRAGRTGTENVVVRRRDPHERRAVPAGQRRMPTRSGVVAIGDCSPRTPE